MAYSEEFKKKVLDTFRNCLGNVTMTCRAAGIHRATFYDWMETDSDFAEEATYIKENERQDFVENALFNRIQQGDTTAIIFAAKTICKDRGYVERHEVVGKDGAALIPSRMTDDEIRQELERLSKVGD